jgi:hypothetical protein
VTFKVKECGPLYGNVKFETSDNEGNLHIFGGIKNFAGYSESLECSHLMGSLGTRKTEVRYLIPLMHYLEVISVSFLRGTLLQIIIELI